MRAMNLVEMLQEGGVGAYAALGFGVLGAAIGALALLMSLSKNRGGFGLGLATMIVADLSAMAGIVGTILGRTQLQAALAYVESVVDKEHITLAGWAEASNAALFGFFGALLPFMLGGAAAVIGAKISNEPTRMQGVPQVVSTDAGSSRIVMSMIFSMITLISIGGAWVIWHQAPPATRFTFDRTDEAWQLAGAIENADCARLEETLNMRWTAADKNQWPRVIDIPAVLAADTKATARKCVEDRLANDVDVAALLTSPLLQEDDLRDKVRTHGAIPSLPPEAATDEGLDKAVIARVVRRARDVIRKCYERELIHEPKLAGKVEIEFTIGGNGDVTDANASEATTMTNAKVVSCIRKAMEHLKFPAPSGGQPVTVTYPFVLNPAQ